MVKLMRIGWLCLLVGVCLSGCGRRGEVVSEGVTAAPATKVIKGEERLVEQSCWFEVGRWTDDVVCYGLVVPRDHRRGVDGEEMVLPVVRWQTAEALEAYVLAEGKRVFDGEMVNEGMVLACGEMANMAEGYLEGVIGEEEIGGVVVGSLTDCYQRLREEGVDFSIYNERQSERDRWLLTTAVGWLGEGAVMGYGTRLGQSRWWWGGGQDEIMIAESYPLGEMGLVGVDEEMGVLVCAGVGKCDGFYAEVEVGVAQLIARPRVVVGRNLLTGRTAEVEVDGEMLRGLIIRDRYQLGEEAWLTVIRQMLAGDDTLLQKVVSLTMTEIDFIDWEANFGGRSVMGIDSEDLETLLLWELGLNGWPEQTMRAGQASSDWKWWEIEENVMGEGLGVGVG
ncbi:MAG TPA: hypothetical protein VLL52_07685, partial [Anaerolineae bacterium]|nr:hypothetical protein [Anaerolineae bacterium]